MGKAMSSMVETLARQLLNNDFDLKASEDVLSAAKTLMESLQGIDTKK